MEKGFGNRLKQFRKERGVTQQMLADMIGCMKTTVSNYETEKSSPDMHSIKRIAEALKLTKEEYAVLTGYNAAEEGANIKFSDDELPYYKSPDIRIPVLGYIKAGDPLLAEQMVIDYLNLPQEYVGRGEFFALKVMGDSMNLSKIDDGDVVIVRRQKEVENGDIAAVLIDDKTTIKQFFLYDNTVVLVPNSSNKYNKPRCIDASKTPVRILGKVVRAIVEI